MLDLEIGEEKYPNQWHVCDIIKGAISGMSSKMEMVLLPEAAVLNWEMR